MSALSVMVVEDDAAIAELVVKNLTAAGFQCHHVSRGDEVLKAIARLNPALLILDIQLPRVDGLELTRRIHSAAICRFCC
ncbi:MAG: response regulator [Gammaproteobacteria bacterium]